MFWWQIYFVIFLKLVFRGTQIVCHKYFLLKKKKKNYERKNCEKRSWWKKFHYTKKKVDKGKEKGKKLLKVFFYVYLIVCLYGLVSQIFSKKKVFVEKSIFVKKVLSAKTFLVKGFVCLFLLIVVCFFVCQSSNRVHLITCWDGIWSCDVPADHPRSASRSTPDLLADQPLIC